VVFLGGATIGAGGGVMHHPSFSNVSVFTALTGPPSNA